MKTGLGQSHVTGFPAQSPVMLVIGGLVALELGAALAKFLFPLGGVIGVVALRLAFAAVALLLYWRSGLRWDPKLLGLVLLIGTLLAAHHLTFYGAVDQLPLGVAVTIEFTGPLVLALCLARRPLGILWATVAGVGVVLTASGDAEGNWPGSGIALAVGAAVTWAGYILVSSAIGRRVDNGAWLAIATCWATVLVLPLGVATTGAALLDWRVLGGCLAVALLCEVLSYSMQNEALRRMPAQAFSILISLEPAVAALLGLVLLGQGITLWQTVGIASVVAASIANTVFPGGRGGSTATPG